MLRVYRSNRLETLADVLADVLGAAPLDPMTGEWLVIANLGMREWLQRALALRLGIAAGCCFPFPREVLDAICFESPEAAERSREEALALLIFDRLPSHLGAAAFAPLRRYLDRDEGGLKRLGLSRRIAHAFGEYTLYRPEMVLQWEQGKERDWQAILWRDLAVRLGGRHIARAAVALLRGEGPARSLPFRRLTFFAPPGFPPLYLAVLRTLSASVDVHLFVLSPSGEWWADIHSSRGASVIQPSLFEYIERTESDENPFLATLGKVGRDFQSLLEETVAYEEYPVDLYGDPLLERAETAVRVIQSDICHLRSGRRDGARPPLDDSVRVVSCHSPEREVEVLKDQLLDLFEKRPGLTPDDILVLAPDIGPYAPFVEAVFSAGPVRIPFNIASRQGDARQLATAFSAILGLPGRRLTVTEVFDLLSQEPVRRRFDLSEQTVLDAEGWFAEAGVRWGIDGAHRAAHGQPAFCENTWRFGLDRWLLGVAMDPERAPLFAGVAPMPVISVDQARALGRLAAFFETLFRFMEAVETERSIPAWVDLFEAAAADLLAAGPDVDPGLGTVGAVLESQRRAAILVEQSEPVPFSVAAKLVTDGLIAAGDEKRWRPYGVTFSDFATMRAIPFQVIALLGMNEGVFPRRRRPPAFDRIAQHPQRGDRQVTQDDRYQFLETLLSVRDTLIVSFEGQRATDNTARPPSVLVSELIAHLCRSFDTTAAAAVVRHPLQPFGLPYFIEGGGGDPRLFSFNARHLAGAEARLAKAAGAEPFFPAPLKRVAAAPVIPLDQLVRFFSRPALEPLYQRLGMRFPRGREIVPPREPMASGGVEERHILSALVQLCGRGAEPARLRPLMQASGLLPHGRAGGVRFDRLVARAAPIVAAVREVTAGDREGLTPVDVSVIVGTEDGPTRVVGTLEGLWPAARLAYGYVLLTGRALLGAWVHHLVLASLGRADLPDVSVCIGRKSLTGADRVALREPPNDPLVLLGDLVTLYRLGSERPVRLFPDLSYDYAADLEAHVPAEKALARARRSWAHPWMAGDPRYQVVFREADPLGPDPFGNLRGFSLGFASLAERVFVPMMDAMDRRGG